MDAPITTATALLAMACIAGCDVMGTVVDLSNTQTQVTGMHVSGPGTITVITGGDNSNSWWIWRDEVC